MLPKIVLCDILVKNVAAFCPFSKSQPSKSEEFWINCTGREISKYTSIDSVMSLLVLTLVKIYIEKEQARQEKIQNIQFEDESGTPGSEM